MFTHANKSWPIQDTQSQRGIWLILSVCRTKVWFLSANFYAFFPVCWYESQCDCLSLFVFFCSSSLFRDAQRSTMCGWGINSTEIALRPFNWKVLPNKKSLCSISFRSLDRSDRGPVFGQHGVPEQPEPGPQSWVLLYSNRKELVSLCRSHEKCQDPIFLLGVRSWSTQWLCFWRGRLGRINVYLVQVVLHSDKTEWFAIFSVLFDSQYIKHVLLLQLTIYKAMCTRVGIMGNSYGWLCLESRNLNSRKSWFYVRGRNPNILNVGSYDKFFK